MHVLRQGDVLRYWIVGFIDNHCLLHNPSQLGSAEIFLADVAALILKILTEQVYMCIDEDKK